jgi:hypothetical protein
MTAPVVGGRAPLLPREPLRPGLRDDAEILALDPRR